MGAEAERDSVRVAAATKLPRANEERESRSPPQRTQTARGRAEGKRRAGRRQSTVVSEQRSDDGIRFVSSQMAC